MAIMKEKAAQFGAPYIHKKAFHILPCYGSSLKVLFIFFTVVTVLKICIAYEYANYVLKTEIQAIRNFPGVWPSQFYDP